MKYIKRDFTSIELPLPIERLVDTGEKISTLGSTVERANKIIDFINEFIPDIIERIEMLEHLHTNDLD